MRERDGWVGGRGGTEGHSVVLDKPKCAYACLHYWPWLRACGLCAQRSSCRAVCCDLNDSVVVRLIDCPISQAGDVMLFSEATLHGASCWTRPVRCSKREHPPDDVVSCVEDDDDAESEGEPQSTLVCPSFHPVLRHDWLCGLCCQDCERRIVLFRFAPATAAYGRGYLEPWSEVRCGVVVAEWPRLML